MAKSVSIDEWLKELEAESEEMSQIKPIETGIDNIKAYSDGDKVTALISCYMPQYLDVNDPLYNRATNWIEQQLNIIFPEYKLKITSDIIWGNIIKMSHLINNQPAFTQGWGTNPFSNTPYPWGNNSSPWGNH